MDLNANECEEERADEDDTNSETKPPVNLTPTTTTDSNNNSHTPTSRRTSLLTLNEIPASISGVQAKAKKMYKIAKTKFVKRSSNEDEKNIECYNVCILIIT